MALLSGLAPAVGGAPVLAAPAAIVVSSLTADKPAPQPVGTTITWSASASGGSNLEYQFSVTQAGRPALIVRDFAASPSFKWTPINGGRYTVTVKVQDASAVGTSVPRTSPQYVINSRIVAGGGDR